MPAVSGFIGKISNNLIAKTTAIVNVSSAYEEKIIEEASVLLDTMLEKTGELEAALKEADLITDAQTEADFYRDTIIGIMENLRKAADSLEVICDRCDWPYPDYSELLFGVR
jgi:glutamine synthetase